MTRRRRQFVRSGNAIQAQIQKSSSSPSGPLRGVRVLDLSRFISGPYCSMILADMGAEVVKVEKPGSGEYSRQIEPKVGGKSLYSFVFNRNKKSLAINVRSAAGKEILKELIPETDILVENFRPGTMEKMGFGWDALREINPGLVMARISGFGQTGPHASRPCLDAVAQAMGGLMQITGAGDGPPMRAGSFICDYTTGMYAALGILAALRESEKTGRGQVVDVSLLDSAVSLLMTAIPEQMMLGRSMSRQGNRDRYGAPASIFATRDQNYVQISAGTTPIFPRFAAAIGQAGLTQDPRFANAKVRLENVEAVEKIAAHWIGQRTAADVISVMEAAEVPCAKVASIEEIVNDPQLRHRKQIVEVDDPEVGQVPVQGVTIHLSETPLSIRSSLPDVGQHTNEVLTEWLDYTTERVVQLRKQGII